MSTEAPDQAAMMEKWMQFATPGREHEEFSKLVGNWTTAVKFWFAPGAPPQENNGTSTFELILGGRYLVQRFNGVAMGQPFEGMGISGFDKFRGEFVDVWLDTMGTAMMISRGTDTKGVKNFSCTMDDPMSDRKDVPMRTVVSWIDADTHKIEMFCMAPEHKEFQNMEIIYKRK